MAMVSHLHHLFNAETCQSYIHRLRWKERPLQCPRCQSYNVGPWGAYHYQHAALSYEMHRQLDGTVEADDLYRTAGQKGQAHQGGKKALGRRAPGRHKKREPGRGHYDKDRPAIIAWVSRQGAVVIHATRDFTV